ncbi:MAG: hypothetical protein EA417_02695 [Gammaproteobacteria bacterium]|nr:MAG: hypothetical protein EA417_02695 [Gammaproteobacteria bacterium]
MAGSLSGGNGRTRSHVLILAPESAQVREVARSWAAGEVTQEDYRMIRSITLEGMLSGEIAVPEDVTASHADATLRRGEDADITEVGDPAKDDPTDITEPNPDPPTNPDLDRDATEHAPRLAWLAGVILLVLGVVLLLTLI